MKLTIEIDCDNAAFEVIDSDGAASGDELARILFKLASQIEHDGLTATFEQNLYDSNGNEVGKASME